MHYVYEQFGILEYTSNITCSSTDAQQDNLEVCLQTMQVRSLTVFWQTRIQTRTDM